MRLRYTMLSQYTWTRPVLHFLLSPMLKILHRRYVFWTSIDFVFPIGVSNHPLPTPSVTTWASCVTFWLLQGVKIPPSLRLYSDLLFQILYLIQNQLWVLTAVDVGPLSLPRFYFPTTFPGFIPLGGQRGKRGTLEMT